MNATQKSIEDQKADEPRERLIQHLDRFRRMYRPENDDPREFARYFDSDLDYLIHAAQEYGMAAPLKSLRDAASAGFASSPLINKMPAT